MLRTHQQIYRRQAAIQTTGLRQVFFSFVEHEWKNQGDVIQLFLAILSILYWHCTNNHQSCANDTIENGSRFGSLVNSPYLNPLHSSMNATHICNSWAKTSSSWNKSEGIFSSISWRWWCGFCLTIYTRIRMETQLLLSFSTSAHLSSPVWDLIGWLQCSSLLYHRHWPVIIPSSSSLDAATEHGLLDPNKPLSCLSLSGSLFVFSPPLFHILTSFLSPSHSLCYVIFHVSGHSYSSSNSSTSTTISPTFSHNVIFYFPPHLLFPSLFFSLSDNDTGKFTPRHFKDGTAQELLVNAAWGTGLVHALQHWGDFDAWWTLRKMQGWAGSWSQTPLTPLVSKHVHIYWYTNTCISTQYSQWYRLKLCHHPICKFVVADTNGIKKCLHEVEVF